MSPIVMVLCLAFSQPSPDGELVRFGGEVAVPTRDTTPEGPVEVAPRPYKPDAIYRTTSGAWRFYDGAKDRVIAVPLVGTRLVGWSPNGGSIITATDDNQLLRWKVGTWNQIAEFKLTTKPEQTVMSPDGHHVLVAGANPDGKGRRFTLFGGVIGIALQRVDRADALAGTPVAASDERVAWVRKDRLEILTLPRLEPERELTGVDGEQVKAMAFASEGGALLALLLDREEGAVVRWDVATSKKTGSIPLPRGCTRPALSHDGRFAACILAKPTRVLIIDTATGQTRATVPAPADQTPVFDANGSRIAFPGNRAVPVWDATVDGVLPGAARAGVVRELGMAEGGRVVARETSGVVRIWDPQTGTETYRVAKPASAMTTSPDGKLVITATPTLGAFVEATGESAWTVKGAKPIAITVAPAGDRVYWMSANGEVQVRDASGKTKRLAAKPKLAKGQIVSPRLVLSPDGARLVAGDRVIDPMNGKVLYQLAAAGPVAWLGLDLVGVDASGKLNIGGAPHFDDTKSEVTALRSDGRWVVAGTRAGAVFVWSVDGKLLLERTVQRAPIVELALDATRDRVYTAANDGVILGVSVPTK